LIIFTLAALFDEIGNDYIEKVGFINSTNYSRKFLGYFFDQRWLTKVAVLAIALVGVIPFYFFVAMLFFDGAYLMVRGVSNSKQYRATVEKKRGVFVDRS
jgi:hypothetical protein